MLNHLQPGRLDVELLRDLFPDHAFYGPTPAVLVGFGNVVDDPFARKLLRKGFPPPLLRARVRRNGDLLPGLFRSFFPRSQLGLVEEGELFALGLR